MFINFDINHPIKYRIAKFTTIVTVAIGMRIASDVAVGSKKNASKNHHTPLKPQGQNATGQKPKQSKPIQGGEL